MNLDGVTGDARKRILAADAVQNPACDRHPECLVCGRRDYHSHVGLEDHTRELFCTPRD